VESFKEINEEIHGLFSVYTLLEEQLSKLSHTNFGVGLRHKFDSEFELVAEVALGILHRSIYKNLDTGLPSLSLAIGDPFKLTSPAQHASR